MTEYQRFTSRSRDLHHSTAILTDDEHQNYVNSGLASDSTIASLSNIGNSCYLNSVLYTLRFTPEFLHKLHHLSHYIASTFKKLSQNRQKSSSLGRNVPGIQPQSARSWSSKDLASMGNNKDETFLPHKESCCIATEKLHELYQYLHNNEEKDNLEPLHTGFFLEAIQEISTTFEGNQQQDAHEFLICLVNSIRDACKSLIDLICANPDIIGSENNGNPPAADKSNKSPPQTQLKKRFLRTKKKDTAPKPPIKEQESDKQQQASKTPVTDEVVVDKEQIMDRIKSLGLDFIREDFEGTTISTTQCLFCETETVQKESMIDLGIQICGVDVAELAKNPQTFFQRSLVNTERLNNDNKYSCEACGQKTEAVRSITYDVLPRLLILQLKRFSSGMEKINSFIPTPMVLKCFCNDCIRKPDCDKKHVYKLYSVITHVGPTMSVGHYIAYITLSNSMEYQHCSSMKSNGAASGQMVNNSCGDDVVIQNQSSSNSVLSVLAKKKIFSSRKASSSSDISKKLKTNIVNGFQKLNFDSVNLTGGNNAKNNSNSNVNSNSNNSNNSIKNCIPCNGLGCCNINQTLYSSSNGHHNSNSTNQIVNGDNNDTSECGGENSGTTAEQQHQPGSKKETVLSQQNWYMCDDDKIKMFTQKEFEEMLQSNKKNPVTPYLLFYVRLDNKSQSNAASNYS